MTEQERFEKWFTRNDCDKTRKSAVEKDSKGEYRLMCARTDWLAWQASAKADRWISVTDELPEPGGHCLIYRPDSRESQGSKIQIVPSDFVRIMKDATHWQPLPPKD